MVIKRWIAVRVRDGIDRAILVDDIIGIEDASETFLKLTTLKMYGLRGDVIVYGTVEEIVDKINATLPSVVVEVTQ